MGSSIFKFLILLFKMKIVLKTLNGKKHNIHISSNMDVKKFKPYLKNQLKINTTINLIYKGRILKDEQMLGKLKLKEKEFLILMPQGIKENKYVKTQDSLLPTKTKKTRSVAKNNELNGSADDDTYTSQLMNSTITNLLGMGFGRDEIFQSLRFSSGNVDLAVDCLLTGISDGLVDRETKKTSDASNISSISRNFISHSEFNQEENIPNQSQVNTWMNQIMQNPALLNQILAAIQKTKPELYIRIVQEMNQNPQVASNLVQQLFMNPRIMTQVLNSLEAETQPVRQIFQLSEEEIKQIVQLEKMGFSRDTVIRAFIVSDRNIEIAASLLFSDMDTFHECLIENSKKEMLNETKK